MRLFVAFDIPPDVKEYMAAIRRSIGNSLARVSWVKKEQIHLTLKFLGEVQPHTANKAREELRKIRFNPFTAYLNSVGVFPDEEHIRVVWVGLEPEDKAIELQQRIDDALKGMFKKEKDFKAHITLGRVKYAEKKEELMGRLKKIKVEKKKFDVKNFKLVKSTITSEGPVYEELEIFGA